MTSAALADQREKVAASGLEYGPVGPSVWYCLIRIAVAVVRRMSPPSAPGGVGIKDASQQPGSFIQPRRPIGNEAPDSRHQHWHNSFLTPFMVQESDNPTYSRG